MTGAWFLQRDDNIFNCPEMESDYDYDTEEPVDYSSSNYIIGVFSILNGLAFFLLRSVSVGFFFLLS